MFPSILYQKCYSAREKLEVIARVQQSKSQLRVSHKNEIKMIILSHLHKNIAKY